MYSTLNDFLSKSFKWMNDLSITSVRVICTVVNSSRMFFFVAKSSSMVWMYEDLFSHSLEGYFVVSNFWLLHMKLL